MEFTDPKEHSPALSSEAVATILAELIRIPSTNPGTFENAIAQHIARRFSGTKIEARMIESLPGRQSVGAILHGGSSGPRLILNGHMDTVPIDDPTLWKVDPFSAEIHDGYMYGRGACDMKAGLAVQIAVAEFLAARSQHLRGSLVLHFAVGEERAEPGTISLLKAGYTGDFGIVTEPTELRIAAATRGLATIHIRLKGESIHASRSKTGTNPAWGVKWVLNVLEDYRDEIENRNHSLLGHGSCTPTTIHGGVVPNAVSDFMDIFVDRRLVPGEAIDVELVELRQRLERARPDESKLLLEIEAGTNQFEPAEISSDAAIVRKLKQSIEHVTGRTGEVYGAPYASDVRNLVNDAGIEAVNFGPGDVTECHCANERVSIQELGVCAQIIADTAKDLLMRAH
jgi:succinyl-diaminopimelate desuccinylase